VKLRNFPFAIPLAALNDKTAIHIVLDIKYNFFIYWTI